MFTHVQNAPLTERERRRVELAEARRKQAHLFIGAAEAPFTVEDGQDRELVLAGIAELLDATND